MRRARVLFQLVAACAATPRGCVWYLCVVGGQRLSTALVLLSLVALALLAHASPDDSSWILGIYDAVNCDDAIWVFTDPSTTASCAPTDVTFSPIVALHVFPPLLWVSSPGSARRGLRCRRSSGSENRTPFPNVKSPVASVRLSPTTRIA